MKAIVYDHYGPPDVLRLVELDKPRPAEGEVLVHVHASALNPLDWHFMRGEPRPLRLALGMSRPKYNGLGRDAAGVVESVGKNVTKLKPGDEVFGTCRGAFAEYACEAEKSLAAKPKNLSFEQAAAFPIAALSALQALRNTGKLRPGQRVLINGASGGVGTFAVQIAKSLGAEVTGVCSTRNVELVRSLGADQVVDYTQSDFTRSGKWYDVIVDCIGNHSIADCARVMVAGGRYVGVGGSSYKAGTLLAGMLSMLFRSMFTSHTFHIFMAKMNRDDLGVLRELAESGKVTPVIDRRYSLGDTAEAVRYLEEGHARGKVVIAMS